MGHPGSAAKERSAKKRLAESRLAKKRLVEKQPPPLPSELGLFGGGEKVGYYRGPFVGDGSFAGGLAGSVVPVGGVPGFALFAMQVRVDHHAGACFKLVDLRVCPLPIAVRVPPERAQRGFKRWGRLILGEGRFEFGCVHEGSLAQWRCELDHMLFKNLLVKREITKAIQIE